MDKIEKDLNTIYIKTKELNINDILDILLDYFNKIKYNYNLFEEIKNNKNILFNNEPYNIFDDIYELLTKQITNYFIYENLMKNIMNDIIQKNNLKQFEEYLALLNIKNNNIKNYFILRNQYFYLVNLNIEAIPNVMIYNSKSIDKIRQYPNSQFRKYKLKQTKYYNDNNIIVSYICFFKSAVNIIIHHPLFKKKVNIDSDSLKLPKLQYGGYYTIKEIMQYGGNELLDLLKSKNKNMNSILELFFKLTDYQYMIGLPGIKYYPHMILQYLLYYLNNDFSDLFRVNTTKIKKDFKYFIIFSDNIFTSIYPDAYKNKILNNNYCMNELKRLINNKIIMNNTFILACPINDPLYLNTFNIILNNELNLFEINNEVDNNIKIIKNMNLKYQYNFFIDDYYLQSFIVIENIKNKLTFHCVYFKVEYDVEYNITNIIRYDGNKIRFFYNDENNNLYYNKLNPKFMIDEMNIFINNEFINNNYKLLNDKDDNNNIKINLNQNYISDYFNDNNYYKICLVCYVKKYCEFL